MQAIFPSNSYFWHSRVCENRTRVPGMSHSVIWDVQYVKIRVKYGTRVWYDRTFKQLTRNGPDSPQNHPKRFQFFSNILYVLNILYNSSGSALKYCCWGGNCLKRPKNGGKWQFLQSCSTAQFVHTVNYALYTIRRIIGIRRMTHPWFVRTNIVCTQYSQQGDLSANTYRAIDGESIHSG